MFQILFGWFSGLRGGVGCDLSSAAHLHRADLFGFRAGMPMEHSFVCLGVSVRCIMVRQTHRIFFHTNVFSERRITFQRLFTTVSLVFAFSFRCFCFFKLFPREFIRVAGVCVCVCLTWVQQDVLTYQMFLQNPFRTMSIKFQLYFRTVSEVFQNSFRCAFQRWVGEGGQTVSPCPPPLLQKKS